jgi:hypothetical protein
MPKTRLQIFAWTVLLLALASAPAADGRNSRLVLMRTAFAPGGVAANARLSVQLVQSGFFSAADAGSAQMAFHPGYLAPPTDRAGLVTRRRIAAMLIGEETPAEPLAVDFAGNRDGRIDVADLVTATDRLRSSDGK